MIVLAMVDWNITVGLMALAAAAPLVYLYGRLAQLRAKAAASSREVYGLRKMQRELEEHLERDKALFLEALGVPFLLLRPSGRLVMANRAAGRLLGIGTEGRPDLLKALEDSPLRQVIEQAVGASAPVSSMVQVGQGEDARYFRTTAMPLGNEDRHVGIVFHDVTELQRTQMIRREFVANASHELRTPLTIIRGYLETLLEDPGMAGDAKARTHALELVQKHAERMMRLVEDMLTLSRLETPEQGYLRMAEFDLFQVAEEVRLRLEPQVRAQQAQLTLDVAPCPLTLFGDKFYWAQILFNLLENALKNNPQPGLQVRVQARQAADGSVTVRVQDDGIGIGAEHLPYIFNRFYRADATGKVKGTGLGLSIVRHAVEAHGGRIEVESEPHVRTVFVMTLPPGHGAAVS